MIVRKRGITRMLAAAVCLALAWALAPAVALADDTEGAWTYRLEGGSAVVTKYTGADPNPVMPAALGGKPVTTIANDAFNSSGIVTLTVPASLTAVEPGAFFECTTVTAFSVDAANPVFTCADGVLFRDGGSVLVQYPAGKTQASYAIPGGVRTIAGSAFDHNFFLTGVAIPEGVTDIGPGAFWRCRSLRSISIPASVTSIGDSVFANCESLAAINVAEGNPNYKSEAGSLLSRDGTRLLQCPAGKAGAYAVPASVTAIEGGALRGCCLLTGVTMGGVASIGDCAFAYCESLAEVTFGDRVASIGQSAFQGCNALSRVCLPASLATLSQWAFQDCAALERAYFLGAPPAAFGSDAFVNAAPGFQVCYPKSREADWAGFAGYAKLAYCAVAFDTQGGAAVSGALADCGGLLAEPAAPSRTGYEFCGWYRQAEWIDPWHFASDAVAGDMTLFAKWKTAALCTISASVNNKAYGTVAGAGKYYSASAATVKALPKAGCRFVRWLSGKTAVSAGAVYTFTVTKSLSLKAEFALIGKPALASASPAGYKGVKLSWKAVPGASGYEIYRSASKSGKYVKVKAVSAMTSYTDSGLTTGKTYYYKVKAVCTAGAVKTVGGFSNVRSAKPALPAPRPAILPPTPKAPVPAGCSS